MQGCREASQEERIPRKDRLGAQRGWSVTGPTAPTHGERPRLAPTGSSVWECPGTSVETSTRPRGARGVPSQWSSFLLRTHSTRANLAAPGSRTTKELPPPCRLLSRRGRGRACPRGVRRAV